MSGPSVPELDSSTAYQLWRANNAMQRVMRRLLTPFGLTPIQFFVLSAVERLAKVEGLVTQSRVCRLGALDENMVSQVCRGLEGRGLLVRKGCPDDRRARTLELTSMGLEKVEHARQVAKPIVLSHFEAESDAVLLPALRSLAERLEGAEGKA